MHKEDFKMHNYQHGELRNETMFHVSQVTGSAVSFSGLAASAARDEDANFELYFLAVLQLLLSTDEPVNHIFTYACTQDAFRTYDESAAYLRDNGILEKGTLMVVVESVARLVMGMSDSDDNEKLSLLYELAATAGYTIPETIDIVDNLRHESDGIEDIDVSDTSGVDMILPNSNGFLEKFRTLYAVECETEMDNIKALEKATEKFSLFVLGNADDVFHAIRASEDL